MSLGKIDSRAFCRLMKRTTATPTHVKMVESVWKVFVFAKRGERVVYPPPGLTYYQPYGIERADSDGTELEARGGSGPGDLVLSRELTGMADSARDDPGEDLPCKEGFRRDSMKRSAGQVEIDGR